MHPTHTRCFTGVIFRFLTHCCKPQLISISPKVNLDLSGASWGTSSSELTLLTLNVALTEFEIMNAVNGLRISRNRKKEIWEFILGAINPFPDVVCFQVLFWSGSADTCTHPMWITHRSHETRVSSRSQTELDTD